MGVGKGVFFESKEQGQREKEIHDFAESLLPQLVENEDLDEMEKKIKIFCRSENELIEVFGILVTKICSLFEARVLDPEAEALEAMAGRPAP
jgi:hypothetical protein